MGRKGVTVAHLFPAGEAGRFIVLIPVLFSILRNSTSTREKEDEQDEQGNEMNKKQKRKREGEK